MSEAGRNAQRMKESFESWREQAMKKVLKFKKNKRFKAARNYWEGYAQACATARCLAHGYAMKDAEWRAGDNATPTPQGQE